MSRNLNFFSSLEGCYGFEKASLQPWMGEEGSLPEPDAYRKAHAGFLNMHHPAACYQAGLLWISIDSLYEKYIIKYSANQTSCENEMLQVTQIKCNWCVSHLLTAKEQPLPAPSPDYKLKKKKKCGVEWFW